MDRSAGTQKRFVPSPPRQRLPPRGRPAALSKAARAKRCSSPALTIASAVECSSPPRRQEEHGPARGEDGQQPCRRARRLGPGAVHLHAADVPHAHRHAFAIRPSTDGLLKLRARTVGRIQPQQEPQARCVARITLRLRRGERPRVRRGEAAPKCGSAANAWKHDRQSLPRRLMDIARRLGHMRVAARTTPALALTVTLPAPDAAADKGEARMQKRTRKG